jgi:hypothetical protein
MINQLILALAAAIVSNFQLTGFLVSISTHISEPATESIYQVPDPTDLIRQWH